jgi:very-short-patch-repair endonuclease
MSHLGINTHYHIKHNSNPTLTIVTSQKKASEQFQLNSYDRNVIKWKYYYKNPKKCQHCDHDMDWFQRKNKFCSSSCAASYNNSRKEPRSNTSRQKSRESAIMAVDRIRQSIDYILINQTDNRIKPKFTKIKFNKCKACSSTILWDEIRKGYQQFCCKNCFSSHMSKCSSERLKNPEFRKNYGRGKQSYMEKSFSEWLTANHISYEPEVRFWNSELNKNYFVDFVFEDKKLIVELDGSQHRKTADADAIRDEFISRKFGYHIIRITHSDFQKKTKLPLICSVLGIKIK